MLAPSRVALQRLASCAALCIALLATTPPLQACSGPSLPGADSRFDTIVLGEVVGIRLLDYAKHRWDQLSNPAGRGWSFDTSPGYEVDVLPLEVFKGAADGPVTLRIGMGCAIPVPELKQFGLFYVNAEGNTLPVYQDHREYQGRLFGLGSRHAAACPADLIPFMPHPCWKPRNVRIACLHEIDDVLEYRLLDCPTAVRELRQQLEGQIFRGYGR